MSTTTPAQNKALMLEAFDTLFNKRDRALAKRKIHNPVLVAIDVHEISFS